VNCNAVSTVSLLYSHLTLICWTVRFVSPSSAMCDATHCRFLPLSFQDSLRVTFCCTVNKLFAASWVAVGLSPSVIWSLPGSYRIKKLLTGCIAVYQYSYWPCIAVYQYSDWPCIAVYQYSDWPCIAVYKYSDWPCNCVLYCCHRVSTELQLKINKHLNK
jgi:hypothetical protein